MAKNLFETLNKKLKQPENQIGMTDQTQQTQSLLRTKLGKAGSSQAVPGISNIQEQQAVQSAQNQQQQQGRQGQILAEEENQTNLAQQQQVEQKMKELDDKIKVMNNSFKIDSDNLLAEFERGQLKLGDQKDNSKAEQLGFQLRLQDQNYINKLKTEGDLSRFNSAEDFRLAAAEQEVADNTALLEMGLDAQNFANMNDSLYAKTLATMDVNQAINLFKQEQEQAKKMAKYKLLGSLVSTGSSAYGNSSSQSTSSGSGGSNVPASQENV